MTTAVKRTDLVLYERLTRMDDAGARRRDP